MTYILELWYFTQSFSNFWSQSDGISAIFVCNGISEYHVLKKWWSSWWRKNTVDDDWKNTLNSVTANLPQYIYRLSAGLPNFILRLPVQITPLKRSDEAITQEIIAKTSEIFFSDRKIKPCHLERTRMSYHSAGKF